MPRHPMGPEWDCDEAIRILQQQLAAAEADRLRYQEERDHYRERSLTAEAERDQVRAERDRVSDTAQRGAAELRNRLHWWRARARLWKRAAKGWRQHADDYRLLHRFVSAERDLLKDSNGYIQAALDENRSQLATLRDQVRELQAKLAEYKQNNYELWRRIMGIAAEGFFQHRGED